MNEENSMVDFKIDPIQDIRDLITNIANGADKPSKRAVAEVLTDLTNLVEQLRTPDPCYRAPKPIWNT